MNSERISPVDHKLMREMNQRSLLNLIRLHEPVSRPQLVTLSGLSLGTVLDITNRLIEREFIQESGIAESTGGRKAVLLEINRGGAFAIGLQLREYEIIAVILNLVGDVMYFEKQDVRLRQNGDRAIDTIAEVIEGLLERSKYSRAKCIGVGCGLSGIIDVTAGTCAHSWFLGWRDVPLREPLSQRLQIPVMIDNDLNCLTSYEKLFGLGKPYRHFMVVTVGRGLGFGIVMNGDLYGGAIGGGSEFGHTVYLHNGRSCECGKRGCLEEYAANRGIVKNYLELSSGADDNPENGGSNLVTADAIIAWAQEGDARAREALHQSATYLGISLANLVNILNPQCIILSGSALAAGPVLLEPLKAVIRQHTFPQLSGGLQLLIDPLSYHSWARGAGSLVLHHFFTPQAPN